jgi:hypothetical protein
LLVVVQERLARGKQFGLCRGQLLLELVELDLVTRTDLVAGTNQRPSTEISNPICQSAR